jgi:hypothetical protein
VLASELSEAAEVDRSGRAGPRLAGGSVERLAEPRRLQAQDPGGRRRDPERVRDALGYDQHGAFADGPLLPLEVHHQRALEDVQRLGHVRVAVERGGLAVLEQILEQEERPVRVLGGELPDVDAASEEPAAVAVGPVAHDGGSLAHLSPSCRSWDLSAMRRLRYHF